MSSTYVSSKFAMEGYSDSLRRELNSLNISVSIIEPGYVKTSIFASGAEESEVSPDQQVVVDAHYRRYYDEAAQAKRSKTLSLADDPSVTTSAIHHAITSKYPKTRYPVANVDGIPAAVVNWVRWLLPDRLMDRVLGSG